MNLPRPMRRDRNLGGAPEARLRAAHALLLELRLPETLVSELRPAPTLGYRGEGARPPPLAIGLEPVRGDGPAGVVVMSALALVIYALAAYAGVVADQIDSFGLAAFATFFALVGSLVAFGAVALWRDARDRRRRPRRMVTDGASVAFDEMHLDRVVEVSAEDRWGVRRLVLRTRSGARIVPGIQPWEVEPLAPRARRRARSRWLTGVPSVHRRSRSADR